MIYCIDANALITPWNEVYSIRILPSLWEKLVEHKKIILSFLQI